MQMPASHAVHTINESDAHGGALVDLMSPDDAESLHERIAELPRIPVSGRQLFDLELLLNGGFSPLAGFMGRETYERVRDEMRLPSGELWPMPIVLDRPRRDLEEGQQVLLCDTYNKPLAIMTVTDVWEPDKEIEAARVYGTTDRDHYGVSYVMDRMGPVYVGGTLEGISLPEYEDFADLRFTPRQLRERFAERGSERVVAFQTRNPLHRAHFDIIRRAASDHDATALIHPVVGETKTGDIDYVTRVKAYRELHRHYLAETAELSLLPLSMRMGGPREALWHAIIRKNYGATHFIIGRDHAGPGKNAHGEPFYGDYDAQELVEQFRGELGIEVVPMKKVVYAEEEGAFIPENEITDRHTTRQLSGTEFREMLARGDEIPSWFSFPEVIEVLRRSVRVERSSGVTIFFTGLSGAGKTTIARTLTARLREEYEREVTLLDGDVVRENLSKGLGFSKEDRDTNIERIGFVAGEITRHGGLVVCSAIAPYRAAREANRRRVEAHGTYIEVYVATPLSVCRERDAKGLYEKADKGLIKNFTGVSDPYEEPVDPEITLHADERSPFEAADEIIHYLLDNNLL